MSGIDSTLPGLDSTETTRPRAARAGPGRHEHGIPSLCFSVLRQFLLIIPLVWSLSGLFGLKGAWCAFPITDTVSFLLAALYFWVNGRRLLGH